MIKIPPNDASRAKRREKARRRKQRRLALYEQERTERERVRTYQKAYYERRRQWRLTQFEEERAEREAARKKEEEKVGIPPDQLEAERSANIRRLKRDGVVLQFY